jgi:hypothetical protein
MAAFATDENGNMILKPMAGWELRQVAQTVLIIGVDYAMNQAALEREEYTRLALVVSAHLALDFAEALKTAATGLLNAEKQLH